VLNGVTSNGATYDSMDYASFMLTAPSGQNFEFLGSTGDGTDGDDLNDSGSGLLNATITVADNASVDAPVYPSHWAPQSGTFTVKPSSYYLAPANNSETQPPLPVGGNSTEWAQSDGSATFASQFETGAAHAYRQRHDWGFERRPGVGHQLVSGDDGHAVHQRKHHYIPQFKLHEQLIVHHLTQQFGDAHCDRDQQRQHAYRDREV
jgi:hypothetical protein